MIPFNDPSHAPMDAVLSLQTYGAGGDVSPACGGQGAPYTTCCWTSGCPPTDTNGCSPTNGCVTNGCIPSDSANPQQ